MSSRHIESIYSLTPLQEGLLFHTLYAEGRSEYNSQIHCQISGLNRTAFRKAWEYLVDRHSALRTAFVWQNVERPAQIVYRQVDLEWREEDWTELPIDQQSRKAEELREEEWRRVFDFARAPLMRIAVALLAGDQCEFIWTKHHIIVDGWSSSLLLGELMQSYAAICAGSVPCLPEIRPFHDYVKWLQNRSLADAERYWKSALAGVIAPTKLPVSSSRKSDRYGVLRHQFTAEQAGQFHQFCRHERVTPSSTALGAWALLLSHYSGSNDVVFGVTVSGRPVDLPGVQQMAGLFVNTLPARVALPRLVPAREWLRAIQQSQAEAREYEYTPLSRIQQWSGIGSATALFDSIVVFENYPVESALFSSSFPQISGAESINRTNYALTLIMRLHRHGMMMEILYNEGEFGQLQAQDLARHYRHVLLSIIENPQIPLDDIEPMGAEDRRLYLECANATTLRQAGLGCIHEEFEKQVRSRPEAPAVALEERLLSYAELNRWSNQIAHRLIRLGVSPETLVGVCLPRSLEMIVAVLAVLKAGGAYVPLDPAYPTDRRAWLIDDAGLTTVITATTEPAATSGQRSLRTVYVDALEDGLGGDELDCGPRARPSNLAYVIYTSGSTGKPKGVGVQHRNVTRLFASTQGWFQFGESDIWTLFHSYAFDFSVWEIWGALLHGGLLVIVPYVVSRSPDRFQQLLHDRRVTVLNQTPSAFRQMMAADPAAEMTSSVRVVIFGGEALDPRSLAAWSKRNPHIRLVNMYGITETTVHVTYAELGSVEISSGGSPIGKRLPDLEVYVLDQWMRPVAPGMPGEIYVGGAGLARGYLRRPALTAERFVPNPFSRTPGERLYRTGDKAVWQCGGTLTYLGRIDQQLKIRGFRIEPGEIEGALEEHPGVRRAAVLACPDAQGAPMLAAYLVCAPGDAPDQTELRHYLQQKLPDYMVPAAFVPIEALPLTANGKLDRGALPSPQQAVPRQESRILPRNSTELALQQIWEDLLGRSPLNICSNFFDLGGTSILAVTLIARVRKLLGVQAPIAILFEHPTIEELAAQLRRNGALSASGSLVRIHSGKPGPAWFWMHPLGGALLSYYSLARHLGQDRAVYGLQARGIEDSRDPVASIPEMALEYIAEIRAVQPNGPYLLGGASMGGAIAYEAACQLVASGLEVAALAILDGDPGGACQLEALDDMDAASVLLWRYRVTDPKFAAELEKADGERRIDLAIEKERQRGSISPDVDAALARRVLNVHRINALAFDRYKAGSYRGKVTLFRAVQGLEMDRREITLGWDKLAAGGVDVQLAPGTHESMAEEPYVHQLAQRLRALADSSLSGGASRTGSCELRVQGATR